MRIFPPELEERAFRHGLLKEWRTARLVSPETAAGISAEIGARPADAAWPLRAVLFGFGALCQASACALFLINIGANAKGAEAAALLIAAVVSIAVAEAMINSLNVRRNGAEEALVAGAVLMAAFAPALFFDSSLGPRFSMSVFAVGLAAAAALAYVRYGYRLAAIGVAAGLGVFVGALDFGDRGTRVMLAALYAALLAAVSLWPGLPRRERERLEIARFFLALSVPLCLNLGLERMFDLFYAPSSGVGMDAFAWATFAAIFLVPAAWLARGISSRARSLIWAGALGLLVAFCSIKPYFGWARRSWDPAALGVELIAVALVLKRWLDAGPGRRRGAFSSEEMGNSQPGGALTLLAGAVAAGPSSAPAGGPAPMRGRGGDFGGGGASGSF